MASEASDDQSTAQNNQKLINSRHKSVTSHEIENNIVKMLTFFSPLFHNVVYEWSLESLYLSCNESDIHYLDGTFLPVPNHQCVT